MNLNESEFAWTTDFPVSMTTDDGAEESVLKFTILIVLSLLIFGLIAHILAFVATRKAAKLWKEEKHNTVPYFLVNGLLKIDFTAVVFFLLRGLASPVFLSNLTFRCEFSLSTNIFFTWASGFANVAMCLDRCFALMAPFLYRKHVTLFRAKVLLVTMVSVALLISSLPFFGFSSFRILQNGQYYCLTPGNPHVEGVDYVLHYTIIFFSVGFATIITIIVGNMVVVCYIVKLQRKIAPMRAPQGRTVPSSSADQVSAQSHMKSAAERGSGRRETTGQTKGQENSNNSEIRLAMTFVVVSIVYTISWLPLYVSNRVVVSCFHNKTHRRPFHRGTHACMT